MENKKKLGSGAIIGIVVLAILSVAALISYIVTSLKLFSGAPSLIDMIPVIIIFLATAYYAAYGYKKPHGDLLRFTFLLFSARNFVAIIRDILALFELGQTDAASASFTLWGIILRGVSIILIAYISGRLDKVKKNIFPLAIVLASHIANLILWNIAYQDLSGFFAFLYRSSSFIFCLDLIAAYVLRYRQHKEAGLTDK